MIQQVLACAETWNRAQTAAGFDPARFACLMDTKGSVEACIVLLFGDGDDDVPRVVAKGTPLRRALRRRGDLVVQTEYETLRRLDELGMNTDGEATPVPLGMWETEGILVTLQTAMTGRLMKNTPARALFSPERIDATVDKVLAWWRRLQERSGTTSTVLDDERYAAHVLEPYGQFARRFVLSPDERAFLDKRLRGERRLAGMDLPFMVRHGDFCTANMVERPDGIGVFDWEFDLRPELPLFDLFHFFGSLRYPYRGLRGESSHLDSFIEVFWGDNEVHATLVRCLRDVCDAFAIPTDALGDLFLLGLMTIANLKFDGLVEFFDVDEGVVRTDAEIGALWRELAGAEKDVPFTCIREGVCENTRFVTEHGLPEF
jgi:hypothetical protein